MDMKKENSMKKTICVILSAVMALALFAGCGAASAPAADTAANAVIYRHGQASFPRVLFPNVIIAPEERG